MRRLVLTLLVVPLALTACSSEAAAPAASAPPAAPSASATGASAADSYCQGVDAFIAASRQALKDPLKADTQELTAQARELQAQATALAGELIDDPAGVTQVQQCTEKLQEFNSGT